MRRGRAKNHLLPSQAGRIRQTFAGPGKPTQSLTFRVGFAIPLTRLVLLILYFLHL